MTTTFTNTTDSNGLTTRWNIRPSIVEGCDCGGDLAQGLHRHESGVICGSTVTRCYDCGEERHTSC